MKITRISFGGETHEVTLGGYLRDTNEVPEATLQTQRSQSKLPECVDLRPFCTPVENQGTLGSCTANAAVGALELLLNRQTQNPIDLSRLFVYYNTRRLRGDISTDTGATIAECMAALLAYGAPNEELWPYSDTERWQDQPPAEIYQQALFMENLQYTRVAVGHGVQTALASGFPVCFGIFLPSSAYEVASVDGYMALARQSTLDDDVGGHAMLIVGYDLLRNHYIVRNSWGERYGDYGYLYIPFELMESCSHRESFWVVGQLEQHGILSTEFLSHSNTGTADKFAKTRSSLRSELEEQSANARKGLRDRLTKR